MNIGIIGHGFVGAATKLFECQSTNAFVYDIIPEKCIPKNISLVELVEKSDIIFICLPTPMKVDGQCYLDTIENVIKNIRNINNDMHIILRSTVPPKTCRELGVHHMPEFLTEKNWEEDFRNCKEWVIGINQALDEWDTLIPIFRNLLTNAKEQGVIYSDSIQFCTTDESEMIKYVRNTFLATKVSFFNEMEEFCRLKGIDYNRVKDVVVLDERIGENHTQVPGFDGKRGFGGTCLPKDAHALLYEMEKIGQHSFILNSVVTRNETYDRVEKDWEANVGRSFIK